ncbi:hypothetical protein CV751_03330 [Achromobacter ruhlandii]|nr:hypothetical protein CV751_03330 [Achromobacter ruhlandii]
MCKIQSPQREANAMTETEKLLQEALTIAIRAFPTPSESTVMDLFHQLCTEREIPPTGRDEHEDATWH